VVDVLRRQAAVLTLIVIADENGPARKARPGADGDLHEILQPDDGRDREGEAFGVESGAAVLVDDLSFLFEDQDDRAPDRNDAQRFERRVEDEGSPQLKRSSLPLNERL
jgi:hypothetical protein